MPPQPITHIRLDNILTCLNAALATLELISKGRETPFLQPISHTVRSLLIDVQTAKRNKDECTRMLEQIHQLIYAIIRLHVDSETGGELTPEMLNNLGRFTETLHKIHMFVEAQQDKNRIRQFFRQGELGTLLRNCDSGLQEALTVFKVQSVNMLADVTEMQRSAEKTHQEVLELITTASDYTSSDGASSISRVFSTFQNSSNSLSLLPSEPKIFHGRESELSAILRSFTQGMPRIAILGAGGMGKTSLSRAVLHHSEITSRFAQHRFFITCDTVSTSVELAGLIGAHIGLKSGKDLTRSVLQYFSSSATSLLILDNLETVWEPLKYRRELEEFLVSLADIKDLALIITMRGAERPAHVRWTRPFLEPLRTLSAEAARQTFDEITDTVYDTTDVEKILLVADHMPLAIDLLANLVDSEGISSVLHRWDTERTSILSEGYDRRSNLELSISVSLSGPTMTASPHARELLSLLAMLPDGLSDVELIQSQLPLTNILSCKSTLLRTALAYIDDRKRLKVLVPIREYQQKFHPSSRSLIQPLFKHYRELLQLHNEYFGTLSNVQVIGRIQSNFANIQNVLQSGLLADDPDLVRYIYSTCDLSSYSRNAGHGPIRFLDQIPALLPRPRDHRLEVTFITQALSAHVYDPVPHVQQMIDQGEQDCAYFDDPDLKCSFYNAAAYCYRLRSSNFPKAIHFCQLALALGGSPGKNKGQCQALEHLAWIQAELGDYYGAKAHANEACRLAEMSANLFRQAAALRIESYCLYSLGDYSQSISLSRRARLLLGFCGLTGGDVDQNIMSTQAEVHRLKSEYLEARKVNARILNDVSVVQQPYQHGFALLNIAQIDLETDASLTEVQGNIESANALFTTMGFSVGMALCEMLGATVKLQQGRLPVAWSLFQKSLTSFWGKNAEGVTYCLEKLANGRHWGATTEITSTWAVLFLAHSLKLKQKLEIHKALEFLGGVFLTWSDRITAFNLFTAALDGFTQMDVHRSKAECMLRLGEIAQLNGDTLKAAELWKTARPLFERSSQPTWVAEIDERLAGLGYLHGMTEMEGLTLE
ncbi:hypothetical protein DFH09DRAFT_1361666 [Mycena vulgaris]|nr:hypothetical protein DFH09DRAFT_1361666 [Mycena vulgaris]